MSSGDHGPRALRPCLTVLLAGIIVIGVYGTDNSGLATTKAVTDLHGGEMESLMAKMEQLTTLEQDQAKKLSADEKATESKEARLERRLKDQVKQLSADKKETESEHAKVVRQLKDQAEAHLAEKKKVSEVLKAEQQEHQAEKKQHQAEKAKQNTQLMRLEEELQAERAKREDQSKDLKSHVQQLKDCIDLKANDQVDATRTELHTLEAQVKVDNKAAQLYTEEARQHDTSPAQKVHPQLGGGAAYDSHERPSADSDAVYLVDTPQGQNSCTTGDLVGSEAECLKAARAFNGIYANLLSSGSWSQFPKGCMKNSGTTGTHFYYNSHSTGTAHSSFGPVCQRPKNTEERVAVLEQMVDGCPYAWKEEDDADNCALEKCELGHQNYEWAKKNCKFMCNPNCDVALAHRGYDAPVYTPTADIAIGHKSCADKFTVIPSDTALHNRAKAGTIRVAVCGKCISEDFYLHVAYMSGDKTLGICKLLIEHELYVEMEGKCADGTPCSGTPMPLKCQEFVKQHGLVEHRGDHNLNMVYSGTFTHMEKPVEGRAMGFTCAQVTVVDFASTVTLYPSPSWAPAYGIVYRLVRGDVAECHSDRETVMRMACINKAVIKSCSMMKVTMNASNTYADKAAAQAAWDVVQKEKFEEGVTGTVIPTSDDATYLGATNAWKQCDALSLRKGTSVGRI